MKYLKQGKVLFMVKFVHFSIHFVIFELIKHLVK